MGKSPVWRAEQNKNPGGFLPCLWSEGLGQPQAPAPKPGTEGGFADLWRTQRPAALEVMPHCQLPQVCPLVSAAKSPRAAGPPGPGTHTCVKELMARSSRDNSLVIANLHRQHPGWSLSTPRSWAKMAWRLRTAGRVSQSTGKYGRRETRAGRWGPLDSCPRHRAPPGIAHTRGRRKPALPDPSQRTDTSSSQGAHPKPQWCRHHW